MISSKAAFDNPDNRATAEQQLRTLEQGSKDCAANYIEFRPVATQLRLDHVTRISWFKHGLSCEGGKMMITQPQTDNFNNYIKYAILGDNDLLALNNQNLRNPERQFKDSTKLTGTTNYPGATNPTITSVGTQPGPMDMSAAHKRVPLTAAEKERWRDNSLYSYYVSLEHEAIPCPQKKQRTAASATIQKLQGGVHLPLTINAAIPAIPTAPIVNSTIVTPAQILYEPKNYKTI